MMAFVFLAPLTSERPANAGQGATEGAGLRVHDVN